MVKFIASTARGPILGLGLSADNIRRLQAGDPIKTANPHGGELLIFAFGSEHEALEAAEKLGFDLPGDPSKIHIDPRLKG